MLLVSLPDSIPFLLTFLRAKSSAGFSSEELHALSGKTIDSSGRSRTCRRKLPTGSRAVRDVITMALLRARRQQLRASTIGMRRFRCAQPRVAKTQTTPNSCVDKVTGPANTAKYHPGLRRSMVIQHERRDGKHAGSEQVAAFRRLIELWPILRHTSCSVPVRHYGHLKRRWKNVLRINSMTRNRVPRIPGWARRACNR